MVLFYEWFRFNRLMIKASNMMPMGIPNTIPLTESEIPIRCEIKKAQELREIPIESKTSCFLDRYFMF